ncbi:MAG: type II toxin-antitoxin system VapB family antitoxin [Microbacteriaceae bacterium]
MSDILVRDVPEDVIAEIDSQAARNGISRAEYVRRHLVREAKRVRRPVTAAELARTGELLGDLLDDELMDRAWR